MSETMSITEDDIFSKLSELKDGLESATGAVKGTATKAGIVAAIVLIIVAFLVGARSGKRSKTVVEVRRL